MPGISRSTAKNGKSPCEPALAHLPARAVKRTEMPSDRIRIMSRLQLVELRELWIFNPCGNDKDGLKALIQLVIELLGF